MPSLYKLLDVNGTSAVVTCASSGMGALFSTYLASLDFSVLLVAVTESIRVSYPTVIVKVLEINLMSSSTMQDIALVVEGLDIGLVINNGALHLVGNFLKFERANHENVIELNVTAYSHLMQFFGRLIAKRSFRNVVA